MNVHVRSPQTYLIIYTFFLFSCVPIQRVEITKEIVVLNGCDQIEITSDIDYSIKGLLKYFTSNNIKVTYKTNTKECGYILKFGDRSKKIGFAMTDFDLWEECKEFF